MTQSENENDHFDLDHFDQVAMPILKIREIYFYFRKIFSIFNKNLKDYLYLCRTNHSNSAQPNLETLIKIAQVLKVEIGELVRTDEVAEG